MANTATEPLRDTEQISAIKGYLKSRPRDYLLFCLGINTGLRISDLLNLSVGDVFEGDRVRRYLRLREAKTGKEQRIRLNPGSTMALEYFAAQAGYQEPWKPLFESKRGKAKPLGYVQAWRIIKAACAAVGVKRGIGTHSLRKTWGYHARKKGVSIEIIQAKFGHSSPKETMKYIGITADEIQSAEMYVSL